MSDILNNMCFYLANIFLIAKILYRPVRDRNYKHDLKDEKEQL